MDSATFARPTAGARLGDRYDLEEPIGSGASADVWRALDTALGRRVAIKILGRSTEDPSSAARFAREAHALARLSHPNVATVYDFREPGDAEPGYIVMGFIEGRSLTERRGPTMDEGDARRIVHDAAAGLEAMHAEGITHRDIKPANLILGDDKVTIVDLGISTSSDLQTITEAGSVLGTPAYASPEQLSGQETGAASDIYSLGVVLFELLSGAPPFRRDTIAATAYAQVHERPPELPADTSSELASLTARMLEKDPSKRPSARDLLAALATPPESTTQLLGTRVMPPVAADPPGPSILEHLREQPWMRWLIGAAALLLLIVLGAAIVSSMSGPRTEPRTTSPVAPQGSETRVPDVTGMRVSEARARMAERDLEVESVVNGGGRIVVAIDPPASTELDAGSSVILSTGDLPTTSPTGATSVAPPEGDDADEAPQSDAATEKKPKDHDNGKHLGQTKH